MLLTSLVFIKFIKLQTYQLTCAEPAKHGMRDILAWNHTITHFKLVGSPSCKHPFYIRILNHVWQASSEAFRHLQSKGPSDSPPIHYHLPFLISPVYSSSSHTGSSSLCQNLEHAEKYNHRYCEVKGRFVFDFLLFAWLLQKNVVSGISEKKVISTPLFTSTIQGKPRNTFIWMFCLFVCSFFNFGTIWPTLDYERQISIVWYSWEGRSPSQRSDIEIEREQSNCFNI